MCEIDFFCLFCWSGHLFLLQILSYSDQSVCTPLQDEELSDKDIKSCSRAGALPVVR